MKRLLLLMLLSFAGTWVSAAEDCFDRYVAFLMSIHLIVSNFHRFG